MSTFRNRKPVNVASVPQRSVFRYPGGKTWLVPDIRQWLNSLEEKPNTFIEPFAGGGIVGLTVAFELRAEKTILIERDENVSAVWETILSDDSEWLIKRILDFEISFENVRKELAKPQRGKRDQAFCTILKNRTFHGGIMAKGASMVKHGESGKGVASRWYPQTLAKRIRNIYEIRERIEFIHGDGLEVIEQYQRTPSTVFFVDPPYTASVKKAGNRLYAYNQLDHDRLFDLMAKVRDDFLMTYDNDETVRQMAAKRGFDTTTIAMQSRRLNTMLELLISRDLDWKRKSSVDPQGVLWQ